MAYNHDSKIQQKYIYIQKFSVYVTFSNMYGLKQVTTKKG